jgi:X-linked retinitis pigmentosa GTPase regulator
LLDNGKLFGFGGNEYGQLGLGDKKHRVEPTELKFFEKMKIKKIYCGGYFTIITLGTSI